MGMTFEFCNEGEIYMICQGSGGGYGDVLERDPALVMKDLAEDLMSHENARDIYKVVYDEKTLVVYEAATKQLRDEYRQERIRRGKPFDKFCDEWVTPEPPAHIPYFGSWSDNKEIKEEIKASEGDQMLKARLRSIRLDRSRRGP